MYTWLEEFSYRLAASQETLVQNQAPDGGWGLTFDSASSIVNTSEALHVLSMNNLGNLTSIERGLDFIKKNLSRHTQPRESGGRGANTRFVSFAISALALNPSFIDEETSAALNWGIAWLEHARTRDGWPERLGDPDTSIHQTAYAVSGLSSLRKMLLSLPELARQALTLPKTTHLEALILHGAQGLLRHRRPNGLWPVQTYSQTAASPSKSSLALLALNAASDLMEEDRKLASGTSLSAADRREGKLSDFIYKGAISLAQLNPRWKRWVEHDPEVPGTDWIHLANAMAPDACIVSGVHESEAEIKSSLEELRQSWSNKHSFWVELGGKPTIRAAFHISHCFQAAQSQVLGFRAASIHSIPSAVSEFQVFDWGFSITITPDVHRVRLSPKLLQLLSVVSSHDTASSDTIADTLGIARGSVAKYIARLNKIAKENSSSFSPAIILTGSSGYYLNPQLRELMDAS